MEYARQVMTLSALKKMGITEAFLWRAYNDPNQQFAWKSDPRVKNSPILFDTMELEKFRLKQIETEKRARKYQNVI